MRLLTDQETKVVLSKLHEYMGDGLEVVIKTHSDPWVFRLLRNKVYYMKHTLSVLVSQLPRKEVTSAGILLGKFTKGGKFRLHITALDLLGRFTTNKIWLKPNGEMPYLYGNHVIKAHVARITEAIPQYGAVIVCNSRDLPLGFGVAARGTLQTKDLEPTAVVVFNQADNGEYLRIQEY